MATQVRREVVGIRAQDRSRGLETGVSRLLGHSFLEFSRPRGIEASFLEGFRAISAEKPRKSSEDPEKGFQLD